MNTISNNNIKHLNKVFNKRWEDQAFKKEFINNPISTIENYLGEVVIIKSGKKVIVEDQTHESFIYLNIPTEPKFDELELTNDQLSLVAGGATPTAIILVTACFTVGLGIGMTR